MGWSGDNPSGEKQGLIFYDIVSFDNLLKALLLTFQAITLEGWSLMMYNYSDSNGPLVTSLFFCSLVIFGAFFALNLVLAEVMDSFGRQQQE